ncbi:MAG: DNA-binding transcriptional regulator, FrmR family [Chloroflexi bacterium]|nr:MAG: DNA-binding transcriptional regulator, FrmR family [Chloroflexota bacterium]
MNNIPNKLITQRIASIQGHVTAVKGMIENSNYCIDILKQSYAIRKALEKLEAKILTDHLHSCVKEGIKQGDDSVLDEIASLYEMFPKK